jgi:hypothetical protein
MLLLDAPAAGAGKVLELDGSLLAACAAFQQAAAAMKRLDNMPDAPDDECMAAGGAYNAAFNAVLACASPRTPKGVQAKALAAFTALRVDNEPIVNDRWQDEADSAVVLAMRCLLDVAGRAEA